MGEIRISLTNFITIGLISYASLWAINHAMKKFGMEQYKA